MLGQSLTIRVLIPLNSGQLLCPRRMRKMVDDQRLNPFEFRAVTLSVAKPAIKMAVSLNPFEFRAVTLSAVPYILTMYLDVLIPLNSGQLLCRIAFLNRAKSHRLNPFEFRAVTLSIR